MSTSCTRVARDNPKDERLFACAEVRDLTPVRDEAAASCNCRTWSACWRKRWRASGSFNRGAGRRSASIGTGSSCTCGRRSILSRRNCTTSCTDWLRRPKAWDWNRWWCAPAFPIRQPENCAIWWCASPARAAADCSITFRPADKLQPIKPLTEYDQKVVRMRQRGLIYPYEIIKHAHTRAGGHARRVSSRRFRRARS